MRIAGLDLLRGIAAFGIVGCHLLLMNRTSAGWLATNLCDMNVGVFATLSGYVMSFGAWNGWGQYLKKRAIRLIPTYLFWSAVFLCLTAVFHCVGGRESNLHLNDLRWWGGVVFWGASACHLWFLSTLFYAQVLFAPLLKRWPGWHWIGISLVLILMTTLLRSSYVTYQVRLLSFLLLGYGLSVIKVDFLSRHRLIVLLLAIGCVALHFMHWPIIRGFLKDWVAVAPVVLAFIGWSGSIQGRLVHVSSFVGVTSMGVYLVHPLFTRAFGMVVQRTCIEPHGPIVVFTFWFASWAAALLVTMLLLQMPRLSRFVR